MWSFLTGPVLFFLNLQMNHNRPIRTASGCIDYCCVIQTSEGEDKSRSCTRRTRSLSAGDVRLLMAAAHAEVVAHALFCVACTSKHTERLFIRSLRGKFIQFNGLFFWEKLNMQIRLYGKCVIVWCLVQHISVI